MLSISINHVTKTKFKTRAFLCPFLVLSPATDSSSSTSAIPTPFFFYSTSTALFQATTNPTNIDFTAKDVVRSFKEWFKVQTRDTYQLDRIFEILRLPHTEDDERAVDVGLSQLGLRLSEDLVLRVLAHGKDDVLSCLKFFDWAGNQPLYHPTRATFHAIFKILSRAKLVSLLRDILDNNMKRHSYGHKVRLCDTLVMGYAVAGKPEIALQLFGKMRFKGLDLDPFGYHVLLNALVEEKCFDAVEVIASQISSSGFECRVTHNIMMKNFCKQNRLDEAEEYLRGLLRKGQVTDGLRHMLSVLVDSLCEKKMFEVAGKLLEEFREMGVVDVEQAYGVWLRDLVRAGNLDGALQFLQSKKSLEGYVPEVYHYNFLVCQLLRENRLKEAYDVLFEMMDEGIYPDEVTMNAVLCFFCKAGMVSVALDLYNSRSEFSLTPNGKAFKYLVDTLCENGCIDEAYDVLMSSMDRGQFPGKKSFALLANSLRRERKFDKIPELVRLAWKHNFRPSDLTCENIISALREAGKAENGSLILEVLSRVNKTSRKMYFEAIRAFSELNRGRAAVRLLDEMQEKGHNPTRGSYRDVIRSLCVMENPENQFFKLLEMQLSRRGPNPQIYNFFIDGAGYTNMPQLARKVFEMMGRDGVEQNLTSYIFMLQTYLKNDKISDALISFRDWSQRGITRGKLYNTMVIQLCRANKVEIALDILREMRENGLVPTTECYEVVIHSLCSNRMFEQTINVINDLEKVGRRVTSYIGNVLLFHSLSTQAIYDAWNHLRDVEKEAPNMGLLRKLIGTFCGRISTNMPIENLDELIGQCFPLDIYTYNMLLHKLCLNQVELASKFCDRIYERGYEPNKWTYDILIQNLWKQGRKDEAGKWQKEMARKGFDMSANTKKIIGYCVKGLI